MHCTHLPSMIDYGYSTSQTTHNKVFECVFYLKLISNKVLVIYHEGILVQKIITKFRKMQK